jgi:hypothetical protein
MTWAGFLIRYLLVMLAGTALIVIAVPQLQQTGLLRGPVVTPAPSTPAPTAGATGGAPGYGGDDADAAPAMEPDGETVPLGESDEPPAPAATPSGDQWGIVRVGRARAYSHTGKFLRWLAAGSILDVDRVAQNHGKPLVVCRLPGAAPGAPVLLVRQRDLHLVPGDLAAVTSRERGLRVEHARLSAEIAALRRDALQRLRPENPFSDEYGAVRKQYVDYWRRVRKLQDLRDKAGGAEHMAYADELRQLKGRDRQLRTTYEDLKKRYEAWNTQHPETGATSGDMQRLEAARARLEAQIAALADRGDPPPAPPAPETR